MTTNFKRGLFRSWVVFSVLWMIPFLVLTINAGRKYVPLHDKVGTLHRFQEAETRRITAAPIPPTGGDVVRLQPGDWEVIDDNALFNFKMSGKVPAIGETVDFSDPSQFVPIGVPVSEADRKMATAIFRYYEDAKFQLLLFLSLTFLPPLSLLALGRAGLWALDGFRGSSPRAQREP